MIFFIFSKLGVVRTFLNKHIWLRVVVYNDDKSVTTTYYKSKSFKPNFLINPEHVFIFNGYRSVLLTNKSAETINPLDFKSKYDVDHFHSAIESKLISETFTSLKKSTIDTTTILLILNAVLVIAVIYLQLKAQGSI